MKKSTKAATAVARSSNSSISLLETVRTNGRWLGRPQTEEEHREKMNRILQHRSEFPMKLRPCIEEAKIRAQHARAKLVLYSSVHEAAATTTAALSIPEMFEKILSKQAMVWIVGSSGEIGTLDKDVDTEEQVELVLRLFPVLLERRLRIRQGSDYYRSVFFAMSSLRSISLVPVFVKVGWEWDSFWWEDNSFHRRGVFQNLLDNFIVRERFGRDSTVELEEESLVVLNRLWKEGVLNQKDFYTSSLLFAFLTNGSTTTDTADTTTTTNDSSRSIDFYERRLRLMIRWDPTILKHSATQHGAGGTLLCKLLTCHDHWKSESLKFQAFKVALEEGMSTYPKELGFLFAQGTFVQACREFGIETMVELLYEQGKKLLAQTQISLQELVMEAATNDNMALEGLYFLIRSNPGSLFSTRHTPR